MPLPLYVWVDHTSRYDGNSGVQRLTRALTRTLSEAGHEIVYVSWNPDEYALVRSGPSALSVLARFDGPAAVDQDKADIPLQLNGVDGERLAGAWLLVPEVMSTIGRGRTITADVIDYCRSKGMKTAFIFCDLVPLLVDGYEDMREAHADYVQQMALADLVLPISAHAGKTLRDYYLETLGLPAGELPRIASIPLADAFGHGDRPVLPPPAANAPLKIVSLGTIEPRKNQTALLRAFNRLCRRRPGLELELHIVGHVHPKVAQEFEALVAANARIHWRRYLTDDEVVRLYASAAFSVFPSREEGFGLPIAESLWFGRPVVCANFGAMDELAQAGGCLTVDVTSDAALETAIERLATDAELRKRLSGEATVRAFRSWADYADDVVAAMRDHPALRRVWCYVEGTVGTPYNSGIQRVVRALTRNMQEAGVDVVCVRWDERMEALRPITAGEAAHVAGWHGPAPREGAPAQPGRGDWLLVPEITLPPAPSAETIMTAARHLGMRVAYVFYDLAPLKLSTKWPGAKKDAVYERDVAEVYERFWKQISHADAILPISAASAADLTGFLRRSVFKQIGLQDRIVTVELAGEFPGVPREVDESPAARSTDKAFTVLSVGTLEPRKNLLRLIGAARDAADRPGAPAMKLVLAGSRRTHPEYATEVLAAAGEAGTRLQVEFIEEVSDAVLSNLYRAADLVAYASHSEGFGLPILEAAWFGRPCLCHNDGAIADTASGGGAAVIDMTSDAEIAAALYDLATDRDKLALLTRAACARPIRAWRDYALDVLSALNRLGPPDKATVRSQTGFLPTPFAEMRRPLLSICMSTYNRAQWLKHTMPRVLELARPYRDIVEVVVCDNAATDSTPEVAAKIAETEAFDYHRNPENVGMLGNMGATVRHASGEYIWLLGDDDILVDGVIEDILEGILDHPDVEMVYLNYAITHFDEPDRLNDVGGLINSATAIADGGANRYVTRLREVANLNENFFTAIYACVMRRGHSLRAYTANTQGKPFSTLLTCIPSSVYVMSMMLDLPAYWIGKPGLVVNMNVSWREWQAPWQLERLAELHEWAEREGLGGPRLDHYRWSLLKDSGALVRDLYFQAPDAIREDFNIRLFLARSLDLDAFRATQLPKVRKAYKDAAAAGRLKPGDPTPQELFAEFGLSAD